MANAKPSTAVTKAKINLPGDVNAAFAAEMASIQKRIGAPSGDRITVTQSKTLKLPSGVEVEEIDGIIVDFVAANFYYTESFDRNNITPPVCFAIGLEPSGLIPSNNSPDKQTEACAGCWANQFGSSGKGKACSNTRLLAVMATAPEADGEYPMYILKVSATAIRSFDGHVGKVAQAFGMPVRGVVTRITLSQDSEYASLRFAVLEPASKELILIAQDRLEDARTRLLTEPDIAPRDTTPAVKGKPKAAVKGKPAVLRR
jgi:hypothetical protein